VVDVDDKEGHFAIGSIALGEAYGDALARRFRKHDLAVDVVIVIVEVAAGRPQEAQLPDEVPAAVTDEQMQAHDQALAPGQAHVTGPGDEYCGFFA
jgi:hypothetical protein